MKYGHFGEFKAVVNPSLCDGCGLCKIPCDTSHEAISIDTERMLARIDKDK